MVKILQQIEDYEKRHDDSCMTLELYSDGSGRLVNGNGSNAFVFDDAEDFEIKIIN
jgi:hypothetical protein